MNGDAWHQRARPEVTGLHAYTPGLQPEGPGWIKLNTNESPYPPSPRVEVAIAAEAARLRLYPEPRSRVVREALARAHGVAPEQVAVGNGSDEILQLLARAFLGPDRPCGYTVPSYSLYPVLAAMQDAPRVELEFGRDMTLEAARIGACGANLFFLTSPNAPTGVGFATAAIARVAEAFPGLLIVDEAYAPFADEDALALVGAFPRVAVVRTFSKSHALAGMRVGYLVGPEPLVALLDRLRDSYNLDRVAQAAAAAAIGDADYYAGVVAKVRATRDHYQAEFAALGWFTYPSSANFLFTEPRDGRGAAGPEVARALYDFLVARRILVRHFPSHRLTAPFLRITVGDDAQMLGLREAIDAWLHETAR